jgi:hypothetical protein
MSTRANTRRVVGAAAMIALAGAGWWIWTERTAATSEGAAPRAPEPFVQIAGSGGAAADRVLQERAEFFDPSPMFLPTARNAGQEALPPRLVVQPGQVFLDFPPNLRVVEANLPSYGSESITAPEGLAEVMARASEAPFAGLGEAGAPRRRVEPRKAFLEVKSMEGNALVGVALTDAAVPRPDFAPLEFLATVNAAGLVVEPLLVTGSGADDVDSFFRTYLARSFRLGEKLAPGVYRVAIGP